MSLLMRVQRRSVENPSVPLADALALESWGGGGMSTSGVAVNADSIFTYHPIWRGVRLISGDVMRTPFDVYRRTSDGREKATEHPAYFLLRKQANPEMTAAEMKRVIQWQAILYGDGFGYVERIGSKPVGIIPLDSSDTYAVRENGQLLYLTQNPATGSYTKLLPENVLHIRDIGDGYMGHGLLEKARNSLGVGMAAEKFSGKFFANGASVSVVIEHPTQMKKEAYNRLRESWTELHTGLDNAHKTAILEDGAKLSQPITMKNTDAQLIESRGFEIVVAANWLGLPPHKLGDSTRVGYNSLEEENQSYLDDCLDHWFVTWESECNAKLLTDIQNRRDTHYCEFNRPSLIRANLSAQGEFYAKALGGQPWMMPDEVRAKLNMNNLPDGDGSMYRPSANITGNTGDTAQPDIEPAPEEEPQTNQRPLNGAYRRLLLDVLGRMAKRLAIAAKRDAKRDLGIFAAELEQKHGEIVREALDPVLEIVAPGAVSDVENRLFEAVRTRVERLKNVPEHQKERLCSMEMAEFEADWPLRETERILEEAV